MKSSTMRALFGVVIVLLYVKFSFVSTFHKHIHPQKEIVIAGLFPTSEDIPEGRIGRGVRPAVELALERVNNDSLILRDYYLKLTWNDTKCDMAMATKIFFDMMAENTTKVMLFGDACPNVTGPIAQISKWWKIFQLSYGDTDPKLSDRETYTNFYRTVPSDSDFNPARLAILRHFNWTRVGTLFQDVSKGADRYGIAHNNMVRLLDQNNIHIVKVKSFHDDPDDAIQELKDNDVRIILGYFDHHMARKVFCSAYKKRMFGAKHQWIITGGYPEEWWTIPDASITCSADDLNATINGYIATDVLPLSSSEEVTASGLTPSEYLSLYNSARGGEYSKYHGYAFDGIWVIAKAMDQILRNRNADELTDEIFRVPRVASALNETNFLGVTGRVMFEVGDRIGEMVLEQFQGGRHVKVGEYQRIYDRLDLNKGHPLMWLDHAPPIDRNLQIVEMQRVNIAIYSSICVLAAIGIVMAIFFLAINIQFRRHRYIKMSSPNMNNVIIVGCIFTYLSIFLLGTDGSSVAPRYVAYICAARSWVLSIGFTLAFGAMFSKTWRVHAIFTNIKLNKKIIKDYKLLIIVGVMLLIDTLILGSWQIIDPLKRATKLLTPGIVGEYEVVPAIEYCTSFSMEIWLVTIYAYKGLLLVFGCFLAWETRHVSIPALNDSKYIGMSVYNVVIMCICGAAVSFVIKDQPNPAFTIISLFILFCTTITLCLVFVPKMIEIKRDPKGIEKRMRATLRKHKKEKDSHSDVHQRIKCLHDENIKYKEIIEDKKNELKSLLEQLGEDVNTIEFTFKAPIHKKVLELRISDMSPSKISRSSSDGDNASLMSDASATTNLWGTDTPAHRVFYHSIKTSSTDTQTESIELSKIRKRKKSLKKVPIEDTSVIDSDEESFGGVYLGPSVVEIRAPSQKASIKKKPEAAIEEHPIIHNYSGVPYLDETNDVHEELGASFDLPNSDISSLQEHDGEFDATTSLLC